MSMKCNTKQKGFSLIEMLVYIALLVLLSGAVIVSIFSLSDVFQRNTHERELADAAVHTLERISREARKAGGFNLGGSQLNVPLGSVALVDGSTTTIFSVTNGRMEVSVNGAPEEVLTPEHIVVDNVVFHRLQSTSTEALRVSLTLSVKEDTASTSMTFLNTAVLRNSYE